MSFEVRYRNGQWTLFDLHRFEAVSAYATLRDATDALRRKAATPPVGAGSVSQKVA